MTVIAFDGKTLASDSQATSRDVAEYGYQKIYVAPETEEWKIYDKRILAIGFAGELAGITEMLENLKKGVGFDTRGKMDAWASCIAITAEGNAVILRHFGDTKGNLFEFLPKGQFCSIGSGGDVAYTYMASGTDAVNAVKKAIKLSITCGGDIQTWVMPEEVKPVNKPEPTQDEKAAIKVVFDQLNEIGKVALEKAVAEVQAKFKKPEEAKLPELDK